ncbi:N-acetylmuramoyl-L-alanine amidase C-terminal domain-containing protein, partial [Bacillus sp. B-TM1]
NFTLKPDRQAFFISEPTSDAQLKGMKEYLVHKGWWYEGK